MKNVLIVAYYWPPAGGAGVQRWLKFVKYLPSLGWNPIVYVPSNPNYPTTDNSLESEISPDIKVLKKNIWEPYTLYQLISGRKKGDAIEAGFVSEKKKKPIIENFSNYIRSNFFIPDARKFWVKPSIRYLKEFINQNPVDAIITTGPPHSLHLIGYALKRQLNIKWIADFRDPWTNIDFYKDLKLSKWADKKHHKLEKMVLSSADKIITIGKTLAEELNEISESDNVEVITNGFDETDYPDNDIAPDKAFSITHVGMMPPGRNPKVLWEALNELKKSNAEFSTHLKIKLVGKVDHSVLEEIKKNNLFENLNQISYVPHSEAIKIQQSAQLLLLIINDGPNAKGVLTGKFFEYLAAGRPILAIGPKEGDVAEILHKTKSGRIVESDDKSAIKDYLQEYYELFRQGKLAISAGNTSIYSRKQLTSRLVDLLNNV